MTDLDLARRAVAVGFRWEAGAASLADKHCRTWRMRKHGDNVEPLLESGPVLRCRAPPLADLLPDLADRATLGVLAWQVRQAHNGYLVVSEGRGWWSVETDTGWWDNDNTASLAEALILALEAADAR